MSDDIETIMDRRAEAAEAMRDALRKAREGFATAQWNAAIEAAAKIADAHFKAEYERHRIATEIRALKRG